MVHSCIHLARASNIPISTILSSKELVCADCDCRGPNLWICLFKSCFQIGCAEKSNDHSTLHNANHPAHCIHMNLSTRRIWCYECKKEVFMEPVSYHDSDQETESTARSRDSGRGSYSTLRTNTPERANVYERSVGLNVGMSGDASDSSDPDDYGDYNDRPCGLVGLQNIGNTCYMNAALQALSNTEPLTKFFLDCGYLVQVLSDGKKPCLSITYQALMRDIWIKNTPGYVTPSGILYGIRNVHAMFRGYQQHDTQEFLRNFMDQLHEELKQLAPPEITLINDSDTFSLAMEEPAFSSSYDSSEGEYETCDSGVSERSSLSDDTERPASSAKRRLSRCGSPNRRQRQRIQNSCVIDSQPSTSSASNATSNRKQVKYRSIISDIFDGKLLSSVQCLTCDRVSSRIETFQDLSLPIPSRDHLMVLHGRSVTPGATCSDAVITAQDGWVAWILAWLKSWFYGPMVTLHDCLAAFFSTDELKGDNMYSCEKCNKLRNGVKFSKVLQLPEILCIHLKRFRHELMFSSKISSAVSFPLKGLDMKPYLHTDCTSKVSCYELFSVICHHGTAGGGHYTCFALNSGQWYEFDDQYVTKVSADKVQCCEAYVLFYHKNSAVADLTRDKAEKVRETSPDGLKGAYISRQWINKFYYCAEPGAIDNSDFLCPHGAMDPDRQRDLNRIAMVIPCEVYDYLYKKFGGCLALVDLTMCPACLALQKRLLLEMETFLQVNRDVQNQEAPHTHYLSHSWYSQWNNFVQKRHEEPPGPIDNTKINVNQLDPNEAAEVCEAIWTFFHNIYGGGPEIRVQNVVEENEEEEARNLGFRASEDEVRWAEVEALESREGAEGCELFDTEKPKTMQTDANTGNQNENSSNNPPVPEFVIPTLKQDKKPVKNTFDKSLYGHGEPMETQTTLPGENAPKESTSNSATTSAALKNGPVTRSSYTNVDDDIDEEEAEEIRSNKRHRRRRKNLVST